MFLAPIKTLLVDALRQTFDADYPEADFRGVHASIEYPHDQAHYPGLWVDFEPGGDLQIAGVAHRELSEQGVEDTARQFTRWRFAGSATFTAVALTSLERDRLADELIRVMASRGESEARQEFRSIVEDNEFIATNFDFDSIGLTGFGQALGTPWGTDDMVYEGTVRMACVGEFVTDQASLVMVPLREIRAIPYPVGEMDPTAGDGQGAWF